MTTIYKCLGCKKETSEPFYTVTRELGWLIQYEFVSHDFGSVRVVLCDRCKTIFTVEEAAKIREDQLRRRDAEEYMIT